MYILSLLITVALCVWVGTVFDKFSEWLHGGLDPENTGTAIVTGFSCFPAFACVIGSLTDTFGTLPVAVLIIVIPFGIAAFFATLFFGFQLFVEGLHMLNTAFKRLAAPAD